MQGVIVRIALGVFGLLTVSMLLLAVFNDKGAFAVYDRSLKLQAVEDENHSLEIQNKQINEEIKALDTDPAAIEKAAREEQGLVKPGEIILILPDSANPAANSDATTPSNN
jgi:cell division protein FtsB